MAEQPPIARKESPSKRDHQKDADAGTGMNGHDDEVARYEQELAAYLQARIKPGLNSGAIPLVARSIAKEVADGEHPDAVSELAGYLQERIKPGLNSGAIPLLARSIAKAVARGEYPGSASDGAEMEDEQSAEADDGQSAEADDEHRAEADDEQSAESEAPPDFETDMHELQAELGEDWILRFSVQGDDAWLTAEKDDGSQRLEAPTGSVLLEAVALLNESGGRSE
jgi:hypothetical protein